MKIKIAVLSPSERHLREMSAVFAADGHSVVCLEGGKSHLRAAVERERPDLLIADGLCCDVSELAQAEYVAIHHPGTAVVLMCSSHTPEYLLQAMRAGVREVLPSPAPADALRAAVRRVTAKLEGAQHEPAGQVLAFLPCKGGSGATFLATNVAWELARDRKVLLIDLNLQFGDAIACLHDGRPATTLADVAAGIDRLDASLLSTSAVRITPGFSVLAAPEDPSQALEVQPEHVEAIVALARRLYDFVVLDLGRSLDGASLRVLDHATKILPVLQPSLPGIRHAAKLRQVFSGLGYRADKVQFVVNGGEGNAEFGLAHVQRSLAGMAVCALGDGGRRVAASIDHGEPLVQSARSSPLARQIIELARSLDPRAEEQKGLLERIFRRA